jgi:hypothetical protein
VSVQGCNLIFNIIFTFMPMHAIDSDLPTFRVSL